MWVGAFYCHATFSSSHSHFDVGSMYDYILIHVARSYPSSPKRPFSFISIAVLQFITLNLSHFYLSHPCMFQCGRNKAVLQQTYYLEERAVSLDNGNADYVTELGFELLLQGRTRDAIKCYRNAMKLDETSVAALTGQLHNDWVL